MTTAHSRLLARPSGLALAAVLLGAAGSAHAADPQDLGSLVVSANRTETPIDQVGSSISVISAADIEKSQATTALDVLQDVPGFSHYSNGGIGKGGTLYIRGIASKGVLVLIDGVNVGDPTQTQVSTDLANLMADDIERIEVLRGNQSTLYGSSAIGGVISITTKSGKGSKKPIAGEGGVEFGSYGTAKSYVNGRGETNGVYYSGAFTGFTTQGFDATNTGTANTGEKDGYNNQSFNLRVGSDVIEKAGALDRLNLEGTARYVKGRSDFDASSTADADLSQRTIEEAGKVAATADMFGGVLRNAISASQSLTRRDYYSDGQRDLANYGVYDGEITKYEYQGTLKPLDHHTFVFGADHQIEHAFISSTASTIDKSVTNDGVFGNYQLGLLDDRLTLTGGVRLDDHETFGDETTWRGTVGYRIPETGTRLHASYGTGYRAPSLYELYAPPIDYTAWGYGYYKNGNPDLKPEKSKGYDVGIEQSFLDDRVVADVTFFNTRMTNEITSVETSTDYYETINVASSRSFGIESSLTAKLTDEVSLTGGHTWLQSRNNETGEAMPTRPHHLGNLRLDYEPDAVKGLDTWVRGRFATWSSDSYNSKPYLGGYAVWDLGASYAITDWASVYGRVENVADKDYHTKGWYAESGRAGYVGLRMKF